GVRLARHYLKTMLVKKTGRVLFIASEAAISPSPEMPTTARRRPCSSLCPAVLPSSPRARQSLSTPSCRVLPKPKVSPNSSRKSSPGMSLEEAEKRFMRENRPSSLIERLIDPKEIADFV